MPASYENVLVTDHGQVRVISLNRVAKKNAFNIALATDVRAALAEASADENVRVVVVANEGDIFSAGVDLKMFSDMASGGDVTAVTQIEQAILAVPKPIIAAVAGRAIGMGVTLLPHFDLVYASDDATFTTPFAKLGIVVEYGSSWTLPRLIGRQRANELVLRAQPVDAATAETWGLVTRVFPKAVFRDEVLKAAQDVAGNWPGAVRKSRDLLRKGEEPGMTLAQATNDEWETLAGCYSSEEFAKAMMAFMQRKG